MMYVKCTIILALLLMRPLCAPAQDDNPLDGSWKSTTLIYKGPDTVMVRDRNDVHTLKVLNETHWMFIRQSVTNQEFVFAQGGRYEIDPGNNTYTEIVEYSSNPENIGKEYEFEYKVKEDKWYHVSDDFMGGSLEEVWRRVR